MPSSTFALIVCVLPRLHLASEGMCCWAAWGDETQCRGYPTGVGGRCNSNFNVSCVLDSDCSSPTPVPKPTPSPSPVPSKPSLPSQIVAGYTFLATVDQILDHVRNGANAIYWSFIQLEGHKVIDTDLFDEVGSVHRALVEMNRTDVLHFASTGGWSFEHSLESTCGSSPCTGAGYADAFRSWNADMKASIPGFPGFAGLDWDLEGADEPSSPANHFTLGTYEIMLNMSQLLQDEFLVTMVPSQSAFNCRESGFNSSMLFPAAANPDFHYAAKNSYAVLYAKCPSCFDLVMVQIYETYSPAALDLYWKGDAGNVGKAGWPRDGTADDMKRIVSNNMKCLTDGWDIDFNGYWGLHKQNIAVPANKVVIGLASPCIAGTHTDPPFKVPYFDGASASSAWCDGVSDGADRIRGFSYWSMMPRTDCDIDEVMWLKNLTDGMKSCPEQLVV